MSRTHQLISGVIVTVLALLGAVVPATSAFADETTYTAVSDQCSGSQSDGKIEARYHEGSASVGLGQRTVWLKHNPAVRTTVFALPEDDSTVATFWVSQPGTYYAEFENPADGSIAEVEVVVDPCKEDVQTGKPIVKTARYHSYLVVWVERVTGVRYADKATNKVFVRRVLKPGQTLTVRATAIPNYFLPGHAPFVDHTVKNPKPTRK